jgi:hypothetical protein
MRAGAGVASRPDGCTLLQNRGWILLSSILAPMEDGHVGRPLTGRVQDKDEVPPLSRHRARGLSHRSPEPQSYTGASCKRETERGVDNGECVWQQGGWEREIGDRERSEHAAAAAPFIYAVARNRRRDGIGAVSPLCAHSLLSPGRASGHHHSKTNH